MVRSSSAAIPYADAAGQDTFDDAAEDVAEDLRQHVKLPQPPQEVQPLLGPLDQLRGVQCPGEVLADVNAQVFEAAHPLTSNSHMYSGR